MPVSIEDGLSKLGAFNRCRDCYATEEESHFLTPMKISVPKKDLETGAAGKRNCGRSDLFPEGKNQVPKIKSQLKTFSDQLMAGDRICVFHIGHV
jgi:hypothetical protein